MPTRREFFRMGAMASLSLWLSGHSLFAAPANAGDTVHVVRRGETLSSIAKAQGVTVWALKSRNQLRNDLIRVGQRLIIPPTAAAARGAATANAALAGVIAATSRIKVDASRWRHIVTHHSGIETGNAKAYDGAHRRRGMEYGLAYHFVIGNGRNSGEGQIEIGRRWMDQLRGGHVRNQNVNNTGIGICLVGNFEHRRPSAKQLAAFTSLVDFLRNGHVASQCKFTVHRWVDLNHTVCPGKHFPYEEMKRRFA